MVPQLLHGCRQLVPWGVSLSGRTSATPVQCYMFHWRPPTLKAQSNAPHFESGRKERTTSSQHGAYDLGNTHPTMANNNETQGGNASQISIKFRLSSDWGLQFDPMKSELLVIADHRAAVNTFSGLVHTARQGSKVRGG